MSETVTKQYPFEGSLEKSVINILEAFKEKKVLSPDELSSLMKHSNSVRLSRVALELLLREGIIRRVQEMERIGNTAGGIWVTRYELGLES